MSAINGEGWKWKQIKERDRGVCKGGEQDICVNTNLHQQQDFLEYRKGLLRQALQKKQEGRRFGGGV